MNQRNQQFPIAISEVKKRGIQAELLKEFPRGNIGTPGNRLQTLESLNRRLCTTHFHLCLGNGTPLFNIGGNMMEAGIHSLTYRAIEYYVGRPDHLSIADYVTDFPSILLLANLDAIPVE